jgi:hypothetical protein
MLIEHFGTEPKLSIRFKRYKAWRHVQERVVDTGESSL